MEPRDAATVMLVRDTPDLHVFMLRRSPRSAFVAGAYVFPGGAVDDEDAEPAMLRRCHGRDPADADRMLATPGALRFWVAAIRESFEEAGVLLARDGAGNPVDVDAPGVAEALEADRLGLLARERSFADVLDGHGAVLDAGALAPIGHWITPAPAPRRYDTWFFVAPAPEGHVYEHDADETVDSVWMRPADALAAARDHRIDLIYPTYRSMQTLAAFPNTEALFDAVDDVWRDDPEPMRTVDRGQGWMLNLAIVDDAALEQDALDHAAFTVARPGRA
ncbi:MAG TPA: NUDIX hydrolase [Acidimicrobiia bacterium]|nr:NUDIX hydrolase [Acidimicrobiia bacterium]